MKKLLLKISSIFLGKKQLQPFFTYFHLFSLVGMNFGAGSFLSDSGELNTIRFIEKHTSHLKDIIIFDVGANIGEYTQTLLKTFKGEKVKIVAIEPSKKTFDRLKRSIKSKNVSTYNIGLGEKAQKTKLFSNSDESPLASVYQRRLTHFAIHMNKSEVVTIKTLDSFCHEQEIDHITFLKLDVEGNELNVLSGARHMLKNGKIDYIQFEFGGSNIDSRTYFQDFFYLLNPEYRLFRILKNGFYPVETYNETQEIFITTNYLAVRREASSSINLQ